ncbi:hypothetical protein DSL72_006544 [Monilinia vaccinii-corymbosi]|uniref:SGNH hydrolase-type esterase domain-containing protein n=1 Tax=Monilinia vaccinii-corymbosi TaxID=61207 RepID=A0A8A3PNS2_9HELO|nr:hypothetical protein DSL72_006544 [Monilinia vaccinii-corymbosi]
MSMLSNEIVSTRPGKSPFLNCPFEIRLMIYRHLIPSIDPSADFNWTSAWDPNHPKSRCEEHKLYSPPILHTNQIIYREVLNELYCFLPYRTSISNYGIRFFGYTFIQPPPAFQYIHTLDLTIQINSYSHLKVANILKSCIETSCANGRLRRLQIGLSFSLQCFQTHRGNPADLCKMLEKNLYPLRRNLRRLNQFVVRRLTEKDISSSNRSVSGSLLAQREEFLDTVQATKMHDVATSKATTRSGTISGMHLRIQPLGNSITFGYLSSDGNGYRLGLLDLLTSAGNTVQYVGSVQAGNMTDNFNEGHPGAVISQIAEYATLSLPENPNLVLLMAGTNDINDFLDITTAPDRLSGLIDGITAAVPNVTVIVAQLTPAANIAVDDALVTFNSKIPDIVASKVAAGQKVSTVNMMDYVTVDDLVDGLHPTDYGYQQIAKAWFAGIQKVQGNGWLDPPIPTNTNHAVTLGIKTVLETSNGTTTSSNSSNSPSKSASNRKFLPPSFGTISISALIGCFLYT